jgi:eukaryotic-like serine/threonine-protein kinase
MADAQRLIEVFNEAAALPAGVERNELILEMCRDDSDLKAQVVSLLRANERAGEFLKHAGGLVTEKPGDKIGRYKLLQQIGEGGCGVVYMAEQEEPVRRRVALKVIKLGMDTKSVIARFEAERQALALMDHPNIARVFDAGATDTGRPFFVMELVRGIKITDYCDQNHLSTAERLKLFAQVCQAIQHAHQKGIIHRDIKPSNILVTISEPGAPGTPKVIDFGIAKATTDQPLTDKTVFTAFEQFIGTPAYMSPEQAMMTSLDVDTRTDIYALGVLLYELLTGRTPFDSSALMAEGLDAMRRIIREQEPARPSTRLSTMAAADLTTVARHRQSEPARLGTLLRGDLDWIVMKALEKDRTRRYDTASSLAWDIQRHMSNEPVSACPPSAAYRFRKFARRNKLPLAVASALVVAILFAVIGLAISNRLITREKDEKAAALTRAVQEKGRADMNLTKAREAVKEFLLKAGEHPLLQTGDFQPLRKELMETAIPFYEEFVRQEQHDAGLEFERGRAYDDLGFLREGIGELHQAAADFEQAQAVFRGLAARFPDKASYRVRLAESLNSRGAVLKDLTQFDAAEKELLQALKLIEQLQAEDKGAVEALESQARVNGNLGLFLRDTGRASDAERVLRDAIAAREKLLGQRPDSLALRGQLAISWNNLGTVLRALRQPEESERAFETIFTILDPEVVKKSLSAGASEPAKFQHLRGQAWNNLGTMRRATGRMAEAEEAFRQAVKIKQTQADTFPSIPQYRHELAGSLNNLGALFGTTNGSEARTSHERAIQIYERLVAEVPAGMQYVASLAGAYSNLGRLIGDLGDLEASLPWLTKAIDLLEDALRRDARAAKVRESLCIARWTRAMTLCGLDRFAEGVKDWDRALEVDDGRYRINLRLKRASNLLNLKDHVRAAADASAVAESANAKAEDFYNAACIYALSVQMTERDKPRADGYAASAVALLRRGIEKGYEGADRIGTNGDLEALRSRDDFKQLLKDIEAGQIKGAGEK